MTSQCLSVRGRINSLFVNSPVCLSGEAAKPDFNREWCGTEWRPVILGHKRQSSWRGSQAFAEELHLRSLGEFPQGGAHPGGWAILQVGGIQQGHQGCRNPALSQPA